MTKPTPTEVWATGLCIFIASNGTAAIKGQKATFCEALIRPVIEALGPVGRPVTWLSLGVLGHHLLKSVPRYVPRKERR